MLINAGQGGISLPNRDYYTNTDAKSVETRAKFVEYMTNLFKLIGDDPATAASNANKVLDLQTRLAKASLTPVERLPAHVGHEHAGRQHRAQIV